MAGWALTGMSFFGIQCREMSSRMRHLTDHGLRLGNNPLIMESLTGNSVRCLPYIGSRDVVRPVSLAAQARFVWARAI